MLTRALFLSLLTLAGCAAPQPAKTPPQTRMHNLLQKPLSPEFAPGREVVVSLVEIPPGGSIERHWHPGEEFHYYLEGDLTVSIDGQAPYSPAPGAVGHVPYQRLHTATAGPRGAKILVFRIHRQGEPVRYDEHEHPSPPPRPEP